MTWPPAPTAIGAIIAIVVIVFGILGMVGVLPFSAVMVFGLLTALAVARLM